MADEAAEIEALERELAEKKAALAARQAADAEAAARAASAEPEPAASVPAPAAPAPSAEVSAGPLDAEQIATIKAGYSFDAPALEMGALVNGEPSPDVPVRIPIAMMNRHGLVAGATGTGKTKTLQVLAEQLSAAGVPVFAADIKGDLSGIASLGQSNEKLLERTASIGQEWKATASPSAP